MQKCSRCKRTMIISKEGWANCPKCGNSQFSGKPKITNSAEKMAKPLPYPTEKKPLSTQTKAKIKNIVYGH